VTRHPTKVQCAGRKTQATRPPPCGFLAIIYFTNDAGISHLTNKFDPSKPFYVRAMAEQKGSLQAPPSLIEPRAKCAWAKMHLDTLKTQIEGFCKNYPYRIETEEDPQAGAYLIKTYHPDVVKALPILMILGDFVENLRASLDYIAWQLALLSGDWPRREVAFPIIDKYTFDSHQAIAKTTFGIPDAAVTVMKSFQPYHSGNEYLSHHLYRLSVLCNVDKHRHISVYRFIPEWQVCITGFDISDPNIAQYAPPAEFGGCTIMRLPLAAKDHVQFNPDLRYTLNFSVQPRMDSADKFVITFNDLLEMHEFIDRTVIPAFASFFPNTEVPGEGPEIKFFRG
jgi:hypothetical protein